MESKKLELAANLAHNATIENMKDLYSEEELFVELEGGTAYKEDVQDVFNDYYDYYSTEIDKVITIS
jgi:hypothetical protein